MDSAKVEAEKERLETILKRADVPQQQRDMLAPVINAISWQRVKLEETQDLMKDADVVCRYNNGGGQKGWRQNPIFKGYLELWRGYMLGLEKYSSYLPKDLQQEVAADNVSILEQVREMKKKAKA